MGLCGGDGDDDDDELLGFRDSEFVYQTNNYRLIRKALVLLRWSSTIGEPVH